jgi:hypothetical protein
MVEHFFQSSKKYTSGVLQYREIVTLHDWFEEPDLDERAGAVAGAGATRQTRGVILPTGHSGKQLGDVKRAGASARTNMTGRLRANRPGIVSQHPRRRNINSQARFRGAVFLWCGLHLSDDEQWQDPSASPLLIPCKNIECSLFREEFPFRIHLVIVEPRKV